MQGSLSRFFDLIVMVIVFDSPHLQDRLSSDNCMCFILEAFSIVDERIMAAFLV